MKKLSKLQESIWTNINKRSEGNLERQEDLIDSFFVTVDGVKYNIGPIMPAIKDFEEEEGTDWFGLGFNTPKNGSTIIYDDFEVSTMYGDMSGVFDVYVLHKYADMTQKEHVDEMIKAGHIDTMGNPTIQKILEKYLNKIYDDHHMSEYADYVINSLTSSDFSVDACFDVSINEYCPDDVEYDGEDILDSNTIMYPVLDDWNVELLKELRAEYAKLGWVESEQHEIDPWESPQDSNDICFLKLKEGAKRTDVDEDDEDEDDEF